MVKKPTQPPKKMSATEKMIADAVKNARARQRSGETSRQWREEYAASLKVESNAAPLSATPLEGDSFKKKKG